MREEPSKTILVIDNYDSFTYNLVQYLRELNAEVQVFRNDEIDVDTVGSKKPGGILLSPGPGRPDNAGICLEVVERWGGTIPIFGVCLGHQTIAQAFGAEVVPAPRLMHGRTSEVKHDGKGVFKGLSEKLIATRYHSLIVESQTLPSELVATAWSDQKELMGLRHQTLPIEGVQFHPESFLTESGHDILRNFLNNCVG